MDDATVVDDATSGDFGNGTGSLEEQLMDSIKDRPEDAVEDQADAEDETDVKPEGEDNVDEDTKITEGEDDSTSDEASDVPMFDVDGKLTLKAGEVLNAEHIKELERGFLRESDYTRKTQEVAQVRKEAEEILGIRDAIMENPQNLRQVLEDQQIVSAFSKPELLNLGLSAAGVPPDTWNTFLTWMKENDELPRGQEVPRSDPNVETLSKVERRIAQLEQNLTAGEQKRLEAETEKQEAAEKQNFNTEVDEVLTNYPNLKKRALLVEMAAGDDSRTIAEIAKSLNKELEQHYKDYIKTKTKHRTTAMKPAKGSAVPVMKKAPQTFDEAKSMVAELYGDGGRRGSEAFE